MRKTSKVDPTPEKMLPIDSPCESIPALMFHYGLWVLILRIKKIKLKLSPAELWMFVPFQAANSQFLEANGPKVIE
jgi:hypothetical protein